ncbi:glycoside hydrolase [Lipomyces orientalis]|uniref:Glycoside hydrolase n=1 Tax=Lipomyces orientalis TaxID=1233043 RepID=A0ACC3TCE7_9ASCO
MVNSYKGHQSQYRYSGKPLVSTFEGTSNINDWSTIKEQTGCYFIPDWSSLGPQRAASQSVIDGAFSWVAWPTGATDMNTDSDKQYLSALAGKPYMMPVSPWFYTNIPQYHKNWLWRGDTLWPDRWDQVLQIQPQLVEIISWNDYGESHYIGPIRLQGIVANANRYVQNNPHDGWRLLLPYYIQRFKTGNASVSEEFIVMWYRPNPSSSGSDGSTTCNNSSEHQTEMAPALCSTDSLFVSVLLERPADIYVQIGTNTPTKFEATNTPGVNTFTVQFNGQTGVTSAWISRNGDVEKNTHGPAIAPPSDGLINWNAIVQGS